MRNEVFWMLYAEGHNTPTIKHGRFDEAQAEAERLAEKLNCEVYVLQAVESVRLNKFVHEPINAIPF